MSVAVALEYLSWSRLTSYLQCPKAFFLHYIETAEPLFTPSSLVLGSAVHDLASQHFAQLMEGNEPELPDVAEYIGVCLDESEPQIRFGASEDRDSLCALGASMTSALLEHDLLGDSWSVCGVEERLEASIDDALPPFLGYADLVLIDAHGSVKLVDFKTTRSHWGNAKLKEYSGQLILYEMLLGEECSELNFVSVNKAKSPTVQQLTVERSASDRSALLDQIGAVVRGIEAGAFPARPGWACASCPYQHRCDHAAV